MSKESFRLLVIDDDELMLQSIRMTLPRHWSMQGYSQFDASALSTHFDAAMVDMHLSGDINKNDGNLAVEKLAANNPNLEIIAMSGDLSRQTMESSLKAGATRFLAKPLSKDEMHLVLSKIEALIMLRKSPQRASYQCQNWVGYGAASQNLQRQIANLKNEPGPFLIEGPSGAGKEVIANLIHQQELDKNRPFVAVNLAAIPENLFESEFFGHIRGAFTGADQAKTGLIEAAEGGDLFLDEIEALPAIHQAKLLRFLESGEIRKVGAKETQKIQTRVIAATNRNLEAMVQKNEFREDLLWRINGHKIQVPSLKERKEDIPLLAKFFCEKEKIKRHKEWTDEALQALEDYEWPGNVRELKRICEQLCLSAPLPIIRAEDVHRFLSPNTKAGSEVTASFQEAESDLNQGLSTLMANFEAKIIQHALKSCEDVDATAKLLGVSRSSLYKKIKDHSIQL